MFSRLYTTAITSWPLRLAASRRFQTFEKHHFKQFFTSSAQSIRPADSCSSAKEHQKYRRNARAIDAPQVCAVPRQIERTFVILTTVTGTMASFDVPLPSCPGIDCQIVSPTSRESAHRCSPSPCRGRIQTISHNNNLLIPAHERIIRRDCTLR